MNVLVSPAHYLFDPNYGSEPAWAKNIISGVANAYDVDFTAVCGVAVNPQMPSNVKLVEVGSSKADMADKALFMYKYSKAASHYIDNADIVHHMFPFGFGMGFNPLAVRGLLKKKPFIIGPIEYPQTYLDVFDFEWSSGKRGTKSKLLFYSQGAGLEVLSGPLEVLHRATLAEAEALVFDSKKTLELYRSRFGSLVAGKRLDVIPPGVEDMFFVDHAPARSKGFEILTVGYLLKRKGIQYLIEAMPKVLAQISDVKLTIVGNGPYKQALMDQAKALGLGEHIVFTDHAPRRNLPELYARSDVYVQPSLSETFPSTIREAMAAGTAVISTDVGVVSEYLQDDSCGKLVKSKDTSALSNAILSLLTDEKLRTKLGECGRTYSVANFKWSNLSKLWYSVYAGVSG